ncbi:MAG: hypothetical protein EBS32_13330, partial [Actinobacteria bacterium]|nr:hypothetical protein [Actinomycetota bacterium]
MLILRSTTDSTKDTTMPPIHGHCDERFAPVRDVFIRNLESGDDVGASVSLIVDGETVVDLWGGWTDESRATEWHLMSHTSGLSGWAQPVQPDDIYDWDKAIAMLSAQEPWWEPGTA